MLKPPPNRRDQRRRRIQQILDALCWERAVWAFDYQCKRHRGGSGGASNDSGYVTGVAKRSEMGSNILLLGSDAMVGGDMITIRTLSEMDI